MGAPVDAPIRVLMITSGWPQPGKAQTTHFIPRQVEFLRAAGVDVDVFRFRGQKSLWNYLRAWVQVRRKLATQCYDVVHAQWGQSGLLAFPKRLPLIVTFRGCDLHGIVDGACRPTRTGRLLAMLSRVVARRADEVIVVSEHMKRLMNRNGSAHVIPSGLDLDLFRPISRDEARRHLGLSPDKRLILFAGNPAEPRKRFALARAAAEHLGKTLPAELVVAWGAPHRDMPYLMSACDAMVFTSMQEGSPNVVKEALACDLPVVSVPVGDVEVRLRGIDGCELCRDERAESIAAALERVLGRGQRIVGREAVRDLDENLTTQRVIAIYRSAMNRRAPHPRVAETRELRADTERRAGGAAQLPLTP